MIRPIGGCSACALLGATKGTAVAAKASASSMRSAFRHIETRVFIMPAILQQSGNWLRCARFARRRLDHQLQLIDAGQRARLHLERVDQHGRGLVGFQRDGR